MREPVCKRAVVREQQRARRVGVEATYRHDAGLVLDELDDRRPAARVARGRHDAGGLVEEHVCEPLLRHGPPVHLDDVVARDERVELAGLAVHRHAPGDDQLVGLAPRRHSRTTQESVQPHSAILAAS